MTPKTWVTSETWRPWTLILLTIQDAKAREKANGRPSDKPEPKRAMLQYTYKGGINPTLQDESAKQHVCLQTDARSRGRTCPWKSVKAQAGSGTGPWSEVTLCGLRLLRGEFNSKKFWEMPPGDRQTLLGFLFQLIAELSTQASKNVYRKKC